MPNWCSNTLHIKGDRVAIADFIQRVTVPPQEDNGQGKNYDILGRLYPTPQELVDTTSSHYTAEPNPNWANLLATGEITQEWHDELVENNRVGYAKAQENIKKYGFKDWYDWNCAKWGTKWGDCETQLLGVEGDTDIMFTFDTAWSPPLEGISHIATMFPTLSFALEYSESGMDYYGFATFDSDGEVLDNCEEISSIEGYSEIDFDSEDEDEDPFVKLDELLDEAKSKLLEDAGW